MTTKGKLEEAGSWAHKGLQNRDKKVRIRAKGYPLIITKWSVLRVLHQPKGKLFVFYKNLSS
jgi:hypothetical protein